MEKGPKVILSDDTIGKVFKKARAHILRDPDVKLYLRRKPIAKARLLITLWRINPIAISNIKEIKDRCLKSYKHLVDTQMETLGETAEQYAKSHSTLKFNGVRPTLLCKYMPKGHATDNLLNAVTKYGSIGEYRRDDMMECKLPVAPEMKTDEFFEVIQARVLKSVLEEKNIDILSIWNKIQDDMENCFFIGSFSDGEKSEHMWHEYAKDDGVCVWFEPDYSKLKVIVYSDYLAEADDLRHRYTDMMLRIANDNYETLKDDLESLTKEIINLSYMSFYTKKPGFDKETEWRHLVLCNDPSRIELDKDGFKYIIESIPGRIVKIESRLSKSEFDLLKSKLNPDIELIDKTMKRDFT